MESGVVVGVLHHHLPACHVYPPGKTLCRRYPDWQRGGTHQRIWWALGRRKELIQCD